MKIRPDTATLVIYSPRIPIMDKLKTAKDLAEKTKVFDGEPVVLPSLQTTPPEFPLIQLSSKSNQYLCALGSGQVSLQFKYNDGNFSVDSALTILLSVFDYFITFKTAFVRCGLVSDWIIDPENEKAASLIKTRYIRDNTDIKEAIDLSLGWLNNHTFADMKSNFWTKVQTARAPSNPDEPKFLVLSFDINTPGNLQYELTREALIKYFKDATTLITSTINRDWR